MKQYEEQPNHNDMYQASDGKWYPKQSMPQNWQGQQQNQQNSYYGQQPYGQQPMNSGQYQPHSQPVYIQQQGGGGAGKAGGMGCLAATCGALLCFNLGACCF